MPMPPKINRQIVLAARPNGAPKPDDFRLAERDIVLPAAGQILCQTLFLSLDPYMRGRISDAPSYAPPVALGDVMIGATVSRILISEHPDYRRDDLILGFGGCQDYNLSDGQGLTKLDAEMEHPSFALGIFGMPGFTAYMGLFDIGRPMEGETIVVAAASGAVGSVVGQMAKIKGCRVVGVAGGQKKCRHVIDELGFDDCVDHREADFAADLAKACPDGIDVYFESVGGAVFDAVIPLLNTKARIPVCGLISAYNATSPAPGPDRLNTLMGLILRRRIRMQGFIIFEDYGPRFGEFAEQMGAWWKAGRIKYREDMINGLENAPEALIGLLEGHNFGKLIVKVAQ